MLIESINPDLIYIKQIPNKGYGVITKGKIGKGEEIGMILSKEQGMIGRKIKKNAYETDVLGRFCNHSSNPNTKFDMRDGEVYLISTKDIGDGEEITHNYGELEKLLGFPKGSFLTVNDVNFID
jgi:hypothetical protein